MMSTQTNYREKLLTLLRKRKYRPMSADELTDALAQSDREAFLHVLEEMRVAGEVVRVKLKRYALPQKVGLITGTLRCNPNGFGFLLPRFGESKADLYVGQEDMGTALDGDTVVARIQDAPRRGRRRPGLGPRAKIIEVLKRARTATVGTFRKTPHFHYVEPDDPAVLRDIYVSRTDAPHAAEGDKVVVELDEWTDPHLNPEGRIVEVLGSSDDASIDLEAAIRLFGLPTEFPAHVLDEAKRAARRPIDRGAVERLDLTGETVITIDPADARDHDDAVSIRRTRNGYELGVHIADVSHYVRPDTALDAEAASRGTSVYFPATVLPMLPHVLSGDVCSLREGQVRPAKSVLLQFSRHGELEGFEIVPSVVRCALGLSYGEARDAIEGEPSDRVSPEVVEALTNMRRLAKELYNRRVADGAIDLDLPETSLTLRDDGTVESIRQVERTVAHRIIEEFMLAANRAVAEFLSRHRVPYMSRVHPDPAPEDLEDLRRLALALGYTVGDPTNVRNLQRLLEQTRGRDDGWLVHLAVLRSLRQAEYSGRYGKHFALAFRHYAHFTSPIRRYPDLLLHRILDEYFADRVHGADVKTAWQRSIDAAAPHCTLAERRAEDAERWFIRRKTLRFLEDHYGLSLPARVCSVRPRGMVVRLEEYFVEGMVPFSSMTDDFYRADRARTKVIGRRTKRQFRIGASVQVLLTEIDYRSGEVQFALVP